MDRTALEQELKQLIIDTLMLEDIETSDIDTQAPLFIEGLGLDSIDALELAMALQERYGVGIHDDADENRAIFASVASLAEFVSTGRTPAGLSRDGD